MSINVEVQGSDTHGHIAKVNVTPLGQLVTAPFAYDQVVAMTLDSANTAFNFFKPKSKKKFVVTVILLTADSNVTGSSVIDVYEASSVGELTIDKSILHIDLLKNDYRDLIGLNLLTTEGKFINAKCDDEDVSITMMGYYVPTFLNGDAG